MFNTTVFPKKGANTNEVSISSLWAGVTGASMTKTAGRGITSVVRTGAGVYTVTFAYGTPATYLGPIAPAFQAIAAVRLARFSALTRETATAAAFLTLTITDGANANTDLATGESIALGFLWADSDVP